MTGTLGKTRRLLINLSLLLFMACKPNCDPDPPTLSCDTVSIAIDPGECVEFTNPCGDHTWVRLDGFRLCQPPAGFHIQTQRDPRARYLCADATVARFDDEPVDFSYTRPGDDGIGQFRVTVGVSALEVMTSATPTSIPLGGSSQLEAIASGGSPPYAYAWTPAGGLSDATAARPTAMPSVTNQYTVVVSDAVGSTAYGSVIVHVGLDVVATATPPAIAASQTSQLNAAVVGGTPPYSYSWQPAQGLNDPTLQSPIASPSATTSYTVAVRDGLGNTAASTARLIVNATLDACFDLTPLGPLTARADASCSSGAIVEYRWWSNWRNLGEPPDASTTVPLRPLLYEVPGLYTVRLEVVDANGTTRSVTRTLTLP